MTPSTKAQAEAMVTAINNAAFDDYMRPECQEMQSEVRHRHFSTALEKLLADNERLKQLWDAALLDKINLQSQLTATEARLETAINLLQLMRTYHGKPRREEWLNEPAFLEVKSIDGRVSSFLSTLTAEKKKVYTPPPAEELHWDCPKCGCCNRFYLGRTKAPCSECGAEKKEEAK